MSPVTVGVTSLRTPTAQWPELLSIGQNFKPFTGNSDVSKWMIDSRVGRTT